VQRNGGPQIWEAESASDLFRTLRQSKDFMVADVSRIWAYTDTRTHGRTGTHKSAHTYAHKFSVVSFFVNLTEQEWKDELE
jgi:hypothetical protein